MSVELIQERLLSYQSQTLQEQENALKEIAQEIALMALHRSDFFKIAAFQGGTCLRILYGLNRFSEDLDFVLEQPNLNFNWSTYINTMQEEFLTYGYALEIKTRNELEKPVKVAFLKTNSVGGLLLLKNYRTNQPKLKIKLEIDTTPPLGSHFQLNYLDFPLPYSIRTQDLPSLFAGKCHALLCRDYVKGRDWYDFIWYVAKNTKINFELLQNALNQINPWQKTFIQITPEWFLNALSTKINSVDWNAAKQDVAKFLKPKETETLSLWSVDFFQSRLEKLASYLLKE